jgi:RNA polymerase-binding transcription factor DksA
MSDDIDRIRTQLEARLDSLRGRLAEFSETLREPEDDDFEEQASDLDDDDILVRLSRAGRTEAQLIEAALKRIDNGTYGMCVECGKPIAKRRLRALPEAVQCLDCARKSYGR